MTKFLKSQQEAVRNSLRLQDKELQEIVDQGKNCISYYENLIMTHHFKSGDT